MIAEPGTIVVSRSSDSWNDFGFQIAIDIRIPSRTGRDLSVRGFLGFVERVDRNQDTRVLNALLAVAPDGRLLGDVAPAYFTMLPDMAAYRDLVRTFGPEESRKILAELKDIVAADFAGTNRPWLKSVSEMVIFRQAFLRTSEAYFAWKNANMLLRGVEFEHVGRLSDELHIEFQLAGRPTPHHLGFTFSMDEAVLPKRFAVIIGKNGVGKSQTLRRIVDAAIKGLPTLTDRSGGRPVFNRLLAFEPSTTSSGTFPTEQRRRSKVWYRRFALNGPGQGRSRQKTADLVVQLVRSTERIRDDDRFGIFLNSVQAIDAHNELALIQENSSDQIVLLADIQRGSEQVQLDRYASIVVGEDVVRYVGGEVYPLSSGEISFLRFAALASLHIENSSLLLFDEPETHLHPNFINQFVVLLDSLLERTGSAAIIATHSAYFVREAFEDQVRVLRSEADRSVKVEIPRMKTFGADVGAISFFIFGEDEPSRLAKKVEKDITSEGRSWDEVLNIYRDELAPELLGEIRAEIEDDERSKSAG
ncbi:AAA family ATPase [Brevundimonas sp.]|uniref:AAA family ATPase n=1 Tax=Brevundimonas sp. TaxID=1871086 RepID=UPI003BA8AC14